MKRHGWNQPFGCLLISNTLFSAQGLPVSEYRSNASVSQFWCGSFPIFFFFFFFSLFFLIFLHFFFGIFLHFLHLIFCIFWHFFAFCIFYACLCLSIFWHLFPSRNITFLPSPQCDITECVSTFSATSNIITEQPIPWFCARQSFLRSWRSQK